jgi:Mg2+ and Co2+ transporter CorA
MAQDAMYALSEVLSFTASSQMQFLNLIDIKLEQQTSLPPAQDLLSLPNLKYLQKILYGHIQKTQRVLDSINNTKSPKWPKDTSPSGKRRADAAVQSLEQDFEHLLKRTETLNDRTAQAITTLMSSISIAEAQRAHKQAKRVGKITFLAFVFVPLSFTTGFFGMNVTELGNDRLGLKWWVVMTVCVLGASLAVFFIDVVSFFGGVRDVVKKYRHRRYNWRVWERLG